MIIDYSKLRISSEVAQRELQQDPLNYHNHTQRLAMVHIRAYTLIGRTANALIYGRICMGFSLYP